MVNILQTTFSNAVFLENHYKLIQFSLTGLVIASCQIGHHVKIISKDLIDKQHWCR